MKIFIFYAVILLQFVTLALPAQILNQAEYFVDTDPGVGNGVPVTISPGDTVIKTFSLNLGNLSPGWHQVFLRVQDNKGKWGNQLSKTFYVYDVMPHSLSPVVQPIVKAEYFYDTDPGAGHAISIPLIRGDSVNTDRFLPVAGLLPGTHRVFLRAQNEKGRWSGYSGILFTVDTATCVMPVAGFTFDTVTFGTPVTFNNTTTNTLPGTVYKWDINNDGTVEYTTRNINHTFPFPGKYQVRLRVENSGVCVSSVIRDIITGPIPSNAVVITGSTTFCTGDSVILTSTNAPPGYTYEWSTGSTSRAITVKTTGLYYVWVKTSAGIPVKSQVIPVQVNPAVVASLTTSNATGGNANGRAEVTVSGGSGIFTYLWSSGGTTRVLNNLLPGIYTVTVSDGNCPVILTGSIFNIPVVSGNLVKAEYFFDTDPGTGFANPLNIRAGDTIEFPVSVSLAGLLPGYHNLYVRVRNTSDVWSMQMQKSFYVTDSTKGVRLTRVQPPIVAAEYYRMSDPGVGNGIPVPVTPSDSIDENKFFPTTGLSNGYHNFFLRVKDQKNQWGLISSQSYYIFDPVAKNLSKNRKAVKKAEYFFDTDPGTGNGMPITFNISDSVDVTRCVRVAGLADGSHTFYLRVIDEAGQWSCWMRTNFTVTHVICTCPVVDFYADTIHIQGNATTLTNLSTSLYPGATFQWDVNNDGVVDYTTFNASHVYPQFGIYLAKLTIKNSDSCRASFLREVVVSPVIDTSITVQGSLSICAGDSVILTAKPGYTYNWNMGQTTQSIVVKESGSYSVRLTNSYGVQATSGKWQVTMFTLPVVNVTTINATGGNPNGTAFCDVTGGTGNYTYSWSAGGSLRIKNDLSAGDYSVTVSDGRCPVQKSFHIGSDPVLPGDIVKAEYFFDTDPGTGNGIAMNISAEDTVPFATGIQVTSLLPGYHFLYVRVKDTYQKWSLYFSRQFYVYDPSPPKAAGNMPKISKAEYFIDTEPGIGNGTSICFNKADTISKDLTVNTLGLTKGYHRVYIRVMDTLTRWSFINGSDFFVFDATPPPQKVRSTIVAAEYFFDTDPGAGNGDSVSVAPTADEIDLNRYFPVVGLTTGNHTVWVRVKDEAGNWSIYGGKPFTVLRVQCTAPKPQFIAETVNAGSPTHLTNTSANITGNTSYQWDINDDGTIDYTTKNVVHTFPGSGVYTVKLTVINTDTCRASTISQVVVGPIPDAGITTTGNPSFCAGDSVILTAMPGYTYRWWPSGATSQSVTVKESGSWYVLVKSGSGLERKSETIICSRHEKPIVALSVTNATGGNYNGSAVASASGGSGSFSFQWSSGSANFYANNLAPGNYTVEVDDGFCPVTLSAIIENHPVGSGTVVAAEYFFNTDPGVGNGIPVNVAAGDTVGHFTGFPVTGLPGGYNRLFIRTMDTYRKWSMYAEKLFFVYDPLPGNITKNQPPVTAAEYFIDLDQTNNPDPGVGQGTPLAVTPGDSVTENFNFSAISMALGYHKIYIRAKDLRSKWGHFMPSLFYVFDTVSYHLSKIQPSILSAEYFFDIDPGCGNGFKLTVTPGDAVTWDGTIPLGATTSGAHALYVRVKDAEKKWSHCRKAAFTVYQCTQPYANFTVTQTCINVPVQFIDQSTNVDPAATYAWDVNNDGITDYTTKGSISHKYTVPGIYQCKLKITHNVACFDSVIKTVVFPFVHLPVDTTIFTDQSLVLDAGAGYMYVWSTGATTQTITVNGASAGIGVHNYSVTVTNTYSCTASDNIAVTVTLPPRDLVVLTANVNPDTILVSGDSATVHCVIKNTGTISAVASVVQYYLSADSVKSPEDQYLGFGIVNALGPGASEAVTTRQFIPAGPDGQVWYILFVADGTGIVVENNEGNNIKPVAFLYGTGGIPETLAVYDQVVGNGQVRCYNALQTITVAGLALFQVQSGGSATFIAGLNIRYQQGTRVFSGGYMHGYITTNGQYCVPVTPANPLVASDSVLFKGGATGLEGIREPPGTRFCYIYPNPTHGDFRLVLSSKNREWPVNVRIYNAYGLVVKEIVLKEGQLHQISLRYETPGVYLLHIGHGSMTEVEKVIRF